MGAVCYYVKNLWVHAPAAPVLTQALTGSGKTTMILNLLKNHFFAEDFSQIILCIPKMSINQMDKTVQEYKNATDNLIQVSVESIDIF